MDSKSVKEIILVAAACLIAGIICGLVLMFTGLADGVLDGLFGYRAQSEKFAETAPINFEESASDEYAAASSYDDDYEAGELEQASPAAAAEEPSPEELQEADDHAALLKDFAIDPNTTEDYGNCLDPAKYKYYGSDIGEFSFFYPADLFCDVMVDDTQDQRDYGMHMRTITFYGSAGTELSYSVYRRTDGRSLDDAVETVHDFENSIFYDLSDVLVAASDDKGGRLVLTGTEDSSGQKRVYDLIKISDEYLYRMVSLKPLYRSDDERLKYAYVTENEYRMCGFSGSAKQPRSYSEYLEEND